MHLLKYICWKFLFLGSFFVFHMLEQKVESYSFQLY